MSVSEIKTYQSVGGFLTRLTVNNLTDTPAISTCRLTAGVRLPASSDLLAHVHNPQGNVSELVPLDRCRCPSVPQVGNPCVGYVTVSCEILLRVTHSYSLK